MRFELKRATATFGVFHPREEKNKGMACDIPFKVTIGSEYLDTLAPAQRTDGEVNNPDLFINELWTVEGYVRRPALNPIKIHRKPEGAVVKIWDEPTTRKHGPLELTPCNLNKLEVELKSPHQLVLSGQVQYSQYNDKELARINALTGKSYDIEIVIEQVDMFEATGDDDKKDGEEESGDGDGDREPGSDDEPDGEESAETGGEQDDPEE